MSFWCVATAALTGSAALASCNSSLGQLTGAGTLVIPLEAASRLHKLPRVSVSADQPQSDLVDTLLVKFCRLALATGHKLFIHN